jgi:hypothetical protein
MDRSEPPDPDDQPSADCFFVGKDSHGNWVVQDADHQRGGLFVSRSAALKFAKDENGNRRPAIVMVSDGLELDMSARSPAYNSAPQGPPSHYRRAA